MRQGMYAIFDSTAEVHGRPMFLVNDATAIRGFVNALVNPQSEFYQNPADFNLFKIGEYDDIEGAFVEDGKYNLGNGLQLLAAHKEELEKVQRLQKEIQDLSPNSSEAH
ncbi:putative nonstructural protein [Eel River basin pequenovirus]|nr:putative nonstructural protein [Eel River basin pequenovirus]